MGSVNHTLPVRFITMTSLGELKGRPFGDLSTITSNPGSQDVQMQPCGDGRVFQKIQDMALRAPEGSTGMVVGLTNAEPEVLDKIEDLPLLLPGLGAQGGDLQALAGQGRKAPILVNVSRGLLFARDDRSFAQRAQDYKDQINAALNA